MPYKYNVSLNNIDKWDTSLNKQNTGEGFSRTLGPGLHSNLF